MGLVRQPLDAETFVTLRVAMRHLVERGTRWVLQNLPRPIDVRAVVEAYEVPVRQVLDQIEHIATPEVVVVWGSRPSAM